MPSKKTVKKTAPPAAPAKATPPPSQPAAVSSGGRIKIRMYRQGLGDCFLITLPRAGSRPFYLVIDCGVVLGTPDPESKLRPRVQDLFDTTGGQIDLLVSTHEHWDHLSGFIQVQDLFQKFTVGELWLAWTEDPKDTLANQLRGERQAMVGALGIAESRMRMTGLAESAEDVRGLLDFFGAAGSGSTQDALKIVKGLTSNIRFCRPSDAPVTLKDVDARFYVLGPPHDEKMIKRFNPSASHPETYGMDGMGVFLAASSSLLGGNDAGAPFDANLQIPLDAAKQMPFFQAQYWGEDATSNEKSQGWRGIDEAWMDSASGLALQLDSATNNTSLVLAIELPDGDVLLFAADAQVGNWLSWQDLTWQVNGKAVTGPDLLNRAVFYKVGHHGSHNATLREKGLEMMTSLKTAMIPVDHDMALKKRWGQMPLQALTDRLDKMTNGRILRIDQEVPPSLSGEVKPNPLYHELEL